MRAARARYRQQKAHYHSKANYGCQPEKKAFRYVFGIADHRRVMMAKLILEISHDQRAEISGVSAAVKRRAWKREITKGRVKKTRSSAFLSLFLSFVFLTGSQNCWPSFLACCTGFGEESIGRLKNLERWSYYLEDLGQIKIDDETFQTVKLGLKNGKKLSVRIWGYMNDIVLSDETPSICLQ